MGIAYRDLKAGRYYKGTLDNGSKVFMFIETVSPVSGGLLGVSACRYERKTGSAQWNPLGFNQKPDEDSRMRREVTLAEVQAEGVSRAPLDKGAPPKPTSPATTGSGTKAASNPSSTLPPKPPALRKDGTPKVGIPDNSRSPTCLHCRKPTQTMVLFSFSAQWCPDCEP